MSKGTVHALQESHCYFQKQRMVWDALCILTLRDNTSAVDKLEISACLYFIFHHSYLWVMMQYCQQWRVFLLKYLIQKSIKIIWLFAFSTMINMSEVFPYWTITPSLLLLATMVTPENRQFFHLFAYSVHSFFLAMTLINMHSLLQILWAEKLLNGTHSSAQKEMQLNCAFGLSA